MSSVEEGLMPDSLLHHDSYFSFLSSEKNYSKYIRNKMNMLDKKYVSMREEEARENFFDIIHDFQVFGSQHNLAILNPLDFIKKYESLIPEDKLIDVYFSLNHYDSALEFIQLKKDELKKCFKKHYISFYEHESTDDYPISDIEYQLIADRYYKEDVFKKKVYSLAGCYKEKELKILLYRYFKDDISFVFYSEEKYKIPLYGFCHNVKWVTLEEIFADLYEKGELELIKTIIQDAISYDTDFSPNFTNKYPFNSYQFYGPIFFELIKRFKKANSLTDYIGLIKKQEQFIIDNINPSVIPATSVLSNEFFANLKYLHTLPKKDVRNHPLYNKLLDIYLSFCRSTYPFDVDKYIFIFKRLFNRLIEGQSLLDMVQITTLESLFHYFKTNEIIQFKGSPKVTLDNINSYVTKQYMEIKQMILDQTDEESVVSYLIHNPKDRCAINAIYLISSFGYENCKKLLQHGISDEVLIRISKIKYKDEEERIVFLNFILKDPHAFKENENNLNLIFKIFKHLKEENYPNMTMKKIIKRINSFEYALLPNVACLKNNLLLLDLVSKGEPIDNKIEGIKLYNDYRLREYSSIPDVCGSYQNLTYETVNMRSPEIISNGIGNYLYPDSKGSSCLTPAGKAASCLFHGAINPHGRFFKVMLNDKIVAYSWLWRAGELLCFDNIEITDEALKIPNHENVIMNLYLKATEEFIKTSTREEKQPLKVVICGKNKIDMLNKPFEQLRKVTDYHIANFKPNNSENLYLDDSKDTQYVLYGDLTKSIDTSDTKHFYTYKPKKITRFDDWSEEHLQSLINSIYFDYCLFTNKKYTPLINKYVDGFIGEDWMIGYKEDGSYDLFYRTINEGISNSISSYLSINVESLIKKTNIITHNYEGLDYLLNKENYEIDKDTLKEYLTNVREVFSQISPEDYYHTPRSIKNFGHIVYDGAITSSSFGHHDGGGGTNGSHFICIASLSSDLFKGLSHSEGFVLDQNLCAFQTAFKLQQTSSFASFRDSRYPIRTEGGSGELQVLDYIELSKAKGVLVNEYSSENLAKILYILDKKEVNLPLLIENNGFYIIDKSELKRLIKLK